METSWRGIFPSLPTPFTPEGDLDVANQRSVVRFAVDHGAHGLICFGLAGEVFRLTPDERLELLAAIVEECAGRIPVLAGVGLESEHGSIRLARAAAAAGADGIVIPPPLTMPPSERELIRYFERVAGAVDLPVMVQDAPEFLRVEVGPRVVDQLISRIPNLAALKLEVAGDVLADWVEELGGRVGIFTGNAGLYLLDCLGNGAAGIAPGADVVDVLVEIYDLWEAGRRDAAWDRLRDIVPMIAFQIQTIEHYNASAKYVLHKRGVISCPEPRAPAVRLNASAEAMLDRYLEQVSLAAV
jgi:4-hydroxy-tetrahydrodipicolinate synthase